MGTVIPALFVFILLGCTFALSESVEKSYSAVLDYELEFEKDVECLRMMGLEKELCGSYDSCQKACYSSTGFCMPIALNIGQPHIYDVWRYSNMTKNIRDAIADAKNSYFRLQEESDSSNFEQYKNNYQKIIDADGELSRHAFEGWLCDKQYDAAQLQNFAPAQEIAAKEPQIWEIERPQNKAEEKIEQTDVESQEPKTPLPAPCLPAGYAVGVLPAAIIFSRREK